MNDNPKQNRKDKFRVMRDSKIIVRRLANGKTTRSKLKKEYRCGDILLQQALTMTIREFQKENDQFKKFRDKRRSKFRDIAIYDHKINRKTSRLQAIRLARKENVGESVGCIWDCYMCGGEFAGGKPIRCSFCGSFSLVKKIEARWIWVVLAD